jgi:hypothetical protein
MIPPTFKIGDRVAHMKLRRIILIAGMLVTVAVYVSLALIKHWQHLQTFKSLGKITIAAQIYSQEKVSHGQHLPASVSLGDLVRNGYLSANDVRVLDGNDVTVYPIFNDGDPDAILVRVKLRNGTEYAAMADGSIAQFPR